MNNIEKLILNHNRFITRSERFIKLVKQKQMEQQAEKPERIQRIKRCFRCFDYVGNGYIIGGRYRCNSCTMFLQAAGELPFTR